MDFGVSDARMDVLTKSENWIFQKEIEYLLYNRVQAIARNTKIKIILTIAIGDFSS
jgi:hypothetical protein